MGWAAGQERSQVVIILFFWISLELDYKCRTFIFRSHYIFINHQMSFRQSTLSRFPNPHWMPIYHSTSSSTQSSAQNKIRRYEEGANITVLQSESVCWCMINLCFHNNGIFVRISNAIILFDCYINPRVTKEVAKKKSLRIKDIGYEYETHSNISQCLVSS